MFQSTRFPASWLIHWLPLCALLLVSLTNLATAQTPPAEVTPVRETSIYIPYTKLRALFEKDGRGVFIPYEKFQELWKAAQDKLPELRETVLAMQADLKKEKSPDT